MEHILTPKVENVRLVDKFNPRSSPVGTLYLTTTHVIFVSNAPEDGTGAEGGEAGAALLPGADRYALASSSAGGGTSVSKRELWILHMLVHTVEKPLLTTSGTQLRLLCSNFQSATFIVQRDRDAHDVYLSLLALSRPKEVADLYCFSYNPKGEVRQSTGWFFHDLQAEFQRQGVPNENWSHCTMNYEYGLCPTYPKDLFIPTLASAAIVEGTVRFRSKGRFPVLTYLHKNNAAIIRCAQPMVGISGVRSSYDEKYVEYLRLATPGAPFIHVIDTRPAMNAMANKAGGKGYESDKYYENIQFCFKGIENIHKMRNSLKTMMSALSVTTSMDGFLSELANSGWLKHVKAVLDTSVAIAACVLDGRSVVVHCSDGWDRTAQTCSLAGLLLDGYYRTMQGFQALVEKDWLAFGHKFSDRCGHLDGSPDEVSPTFAQFLDCVWQLQCQFPQAFQFNERYLIAIHEHAYSCQFGTFVGNCQRERARLVLSERTYSLWGHLVAHHDEYTNPLYRADSAADILRPDTSPQNVRFWSGLYCRFESGTHPREPPADLLSIMQGHTSSLEDHGRQLSKTLGQMSQMIASAKGAGAAVRKYLPTAGAGVTTGIVAASPTRETAPAPSSAGSAPPSAAPDATTTLSTAVSAATFDHLRGGVGQSPSSASSAAAASASAETSLDAEFGRMERKFTDLKSSFVEKCQSRFTNAGGGLLSLVAVAETLPVLHQTIAVGTGKDGLAKIPRADLDILSEVDVDADVAAVTPIIRSSQVRALLASAALDWEPLDHRGGCRACGRPLGESWAQPRVHCRRCGAAFCGRRCCIRRRVQPQPVAFCEDSSTDSSTTNGDESGGGPPKPVPVCNQCHRAAREERRTAGLADMAEEEGDEEDDDDDDEEEGATDEDMFAYGGEEEEDFA